MSPMQFRKTCICLLIGCLAGMLLFCVWYLAHDYVQLRDQYLSWNNCFYRSSFWTAEFFTPAIKAAGNRWCMLSIAFCIGGIGLLFYRLRQKKDRDYAAPVRIRFEREVFLITALAAGLGIYSYNLIFPAYDEIFSAINVASLPSVQAWSYYMLPNNHILFNLVNGLLFAHFKDHVMTGRWLSIVAYALVAIVIWRWLKAYLTSIPLRVITLLLLLVQLPVWGFSAQGRGYGWQLFAGWVLFTSVIAYRRKNDAAFLVPILWSTWLGYALIPSFLHFHMAIIAFAACCQLYYREFDYRFWLFQAFAGCLLFLFYAPALCFSGFNALADNRYVVAGAGSWEEFFPDFLNTFKYYVNYCFAFLLGENNRINYALFVTPVLLLFSKDSHKKWLGIFYGIMWTSFIVLVLFMKRNPFNRNLIIHYSITLALVSYTLYTIISWASVRVRLQTAGYILYSLSIMALGYHFITTYPKNAVSILYFNAANDLYASNKKNVKSVPATAQVYCSPESFYWLYLRKINGAPATYCPTGKEQYLVKRGTGELSVIDTTGYRRVQSFPDDYELWQKQ